MPHQGLALQPDCKAACPRDNAAHRPGAKTARTPGKVWITHPPTVASASTCDHTRRWHRCVAASTWGGRRKLAGQSLSARTARLRQGRLGRGEVAAGPMGPPGEKRQAEESLGNWRTGEDCVEVLGPPHFTLVSSYFKTLGSLLFYYGSFEILFGEGTV